MARSMRARALGAGAGAGALALGGLPVVAADAPRLFDGLTSNGGLAMVALSAVCGLATLTLLWRERYGAARAGAAGAVGAIVAGWALAQQPYVLPGQLTLEQAAASEPVLEVLLVTVAIGLALVIPALWLLFSLFLRGRLEPGDQPRP
jgi:cytochrome d ubiquinol oxidase subunit II